MQAKNKNRLIISTVFLLFAVPIVLAYVLGSGLINYEPDATKNHGVFISPPVKPGNYTESDWVEDLNEQWTLLYRTDATCSQDCYQWEDKLHRYNLSLAQRADKLSLVLLAQDFENRDQDPYKHIQKISTRDEAALNTLFDELSKQSYGQGEGLYVVAPEGYIMMAFTSDNKPSEVIKDLKLLVKRKG